MEKVIGGKGDGEVWLVERGEGYRGKGALVAWMQTSEAILAKQSGSVHHCLAVAYLAVVALLLQHRYY